MGLFLSGGCFVLCILFPFCIFRKCVTYFTNLLDWMCSSRMFIGAGGLGKRKSGRDSLLLL